MREHRELRRGAPDVLTSDVETVPVVVSPGDYPQMQRMEATLEEKSAKVFLLKKGKARLDGGRTRQRIGNGAHSALTSAHA